MNTGSRTLKSVKNAKVALFFYFITLLLQFFSRKIFLDYLGAEVLGLNTTAQNLLGFLNLAELGISSAISYALYVPLARKNYQEVNEIVSVQGYLYHRIGFLIIGAAVVLMGFFPWLFQKAEVPLWYTYATFSVLLASALAGYFFNYRQIVLTADQKEYKLNYAVQSVRVGKVILQILAMIFLPNGYIWWLGIELFATILSVFAIQFVLKHEYPWLKTEVSQGKLYRLKYPLILVKTKQLFFHRIGGFALTQTSPLIIYAYTSLALVAVYGNYMLIVTGVTVLMNAVFNGVGAGVGNLVAEGDKVKMLRVFDELFSSRFLMVSTICYGVYTLASSFIVLWVGREYLLDHLSLLLIVGIMYIGMMRSVVDSYINALGLFQDVWAPVVEAVLNVGLSILFGYWWGLPGILGGVLASLLLLVFVWKPWFLFSRGFQVSVFPYVVLYLRHIGAFLVTAFLMFYLVRFIPFQPETSYLYFVSYGILTVGMFGIILLGLLYITNQGMKDFVARISVLIKGKN